MESMDDFAGPTTGDLGEPRGPGYRYSRRAEVQGAGSGLARWRRATTGAFNPRRPASGLWLARRGAGSRCSNRRGARQQAWPM